MASSSLFTFLTLSWLFNLTQGEVLFEDGYTVTTVVDGDKVNVNPQLILPQYGSSDFILLDSSASTFYTVSFPSPQESVIKRLTGSSIPGYVDGNLGSASFNKPKSFTVDLKGNIYVADKNNHAIRKISQSGVTTIAGGYTQKSGRTDGPAQNATFSDDFELAFAAGQCALMISDHGNRLVRQINLKAEVCKQTTNNVLGASFAWILSLVLSGLVGLAIGFFVRPYITRQGGQGPYLCKETWNHFLINLGRQVWTLYFDIKSVVVSSPPCPLLRKLVMLVLSHLTVMFRYRVVENETSYEKPISLLDSDHIGNSHVPKCQMITNQLVDLMTFDEGLVLSDSAEKTFRKDEGTDGSPASNIKIDNMIHVNITEFAQATRPCLPDSSICSVGLVKRRSK